MKTQLTLLESNTNSTLLPHNNSNNKSIFKNSNIQPIQKNITAHALQTTIKRNALNEEHWKLRERARTLKASNKELRTALESANIMAHNLKSPLMALQLLLSKNTISDSNKSILNLALTKITKTVDDLQLLDTAYESCLDKKKTYKIEFNSFIEECFNEVSHIYEADKNISFELNLVKKPLDTLICPEDFKDCFYNIIKNAYEAIEYQGKINVSIHYNHQEIEIRISDTGKGIPIQIINQLGNKRMTHEKRGGTGIGLYHVKKVMEQCSGRFVVNSEPGQGTHISLLLPRAN